MWSCHEGKRKLSSQNTQHVKNISRGTKIVTWLYIFEKNQNKTQMKSRQDPFCSLFASFFGSTLSSIFGTPLTSPLCSSAASTPPPPPCFCCASFFPSFHGNFQSHQRDSEWKVSFEFQRPDRTCCFHQPRSSPRSATFRINHPGRRFLSATEKQRETERDDRKCHVSRGDDIAGSSCREGRWNESVGLYVFSHSQGKSLKETVSVSEPEPHTWC